MCVRERTGVRDGTEREAERVGEEERREKRMEGGGREEGKGERGVPPVSHTHTLGGQGEGQREGEVQAEERMEGGQRGGTWWQEGTGEHGGNEKSGK